MKPKLLLPLLIIVAMTNIHCYCSDPDLSQDLIDRSSHIFEGKLEAVEKVGESDNEVVLVFKLVKAHKGDMDEKVRVKTMRGSCSFNQYPSHDKELIGQHFILYVERFQGELSYHECGDRMIQHRKPKKEVDRFDRFKYKVPGNSELFQWERKNLVRLMKGKEMTELPQGVSHDPAHSEPKF